MYIILLNLLPKTKQKKNLKMKKNETELVIGILGQYEWV